MKKYSSTQEIYSSHYVINCQKITVIFIALLSIAVTQNCFSQVQFEKTYGSATKNEFGRSVKQLSNGAGYIITGYATKGASNKDIYVLKMDTCGRESISRTYGGSQDDQAVAITELNGGNFAVAGQTKSYGSGLNDAYLMKITGASLNNANGRAIGDSLEDVGEDFRQTSDNGYIVTGTTDRSNGNDDVLLTKFSSTLALQWSTKIGGSADDNGFSVQQITGGGYILAGATKSYGAGNWDVYLVKTNSSGVVTWANTYGTTNADLGYGVKQTLDGGFIIVGKTKNSNVAGNSMDDVLLVKVNAAGTLQWMKSYGGTNEETGEHVIQLSDSSYVVVGYTKSFGSGNWDVYLFKVDKNGNTVWARTCGGTDEDKAYEIEATTDNGFIVCGHTSSFGAGGSDAYLIKTNSLGLSGCNDTSAINTYAPNDTTLSGFMQDSLITVVNGAAVDTFTTIDSTHCSTCNPARSSVEQIILDPKVSVYPNPANDHINIVLGNLSPEPIDIAVYNSFGTLIQKQKNIDPATTTVKLSTQDWPDGMYLLKIGSGNTYVHKKIIVTK